MKGLKSNYVSMSLNAKHWKGAKTDKQVYERKIAWGMGGRRRVGYHVVRNILDIVWSKYGPNILKNKYSTTRENSHPGEIWFILNPCGSMGGSPGIKFKKYMTADQDDDKINGNYPKKKMNYKLIHPGKCKHVTRKKWTHSKNNKLWKDDKCAKDNRCLRMRS